MDLTKQFVTKQNLAEDINSLTLKITQLANDETIEMAARAIAQYMLLCENIKLKDAIQLFNRPGAERLLWKMVNSQSDFMGPTPRSIGIDLVSECAASKLQSSLDVKHVKKKINNELQVDRIKPILKIDLAHKHPEKIWIRFYSVKNVNNLENVIRNVSVFQVTKNVYELYWYKQNPILESIMDIMTKLETLYDADLIFCSELPLFLYNSLLFLSNYVKFMWCYTLNRNIFDPSSFEDVRLMSVYITYGLLFLSTNNISNMPIDTHGPLIACSGERPKVVLNKFDNLQVFKNEGSRAMQSLDKSADMGTYSNFIEIVSEFEIPCNCLDKIV